MDNFDLNSHKHIHFIGIGGISMSQLAIYCTQLNLKVTGSDARVSKYTNLCADNGIKVVIGHKRKNINGADLVVCTGAISGENAEMIEARKRGIKILDRAEFLAYICKKFKYVIGIAGTHGKTTTSAMIYHILRECGKKVSCHIGADVENARLNPDDDYLVLECCEYNKSFLKLYYNIGVVLNIDNDHLDCYQNMYNLQNAFKTFLKHADTRFVFQNDTTKCIRNRAIRIKQPVITAINKFEYCGRKFVLNNVYGEHNINNATVAIGVCLNLGLLYTKIRKAIKSFKSAGRRCELLKTINNVDILADYAHHPAEINSLYNSLKTKYGRVCIVFQPHTFSRTKLLIYEFVKMFTTVDKLWIFKEYSAREHKSKGYSAKQLCEYLDNAVYVKNYRQLIKQFPFGKVENGDCIVFVGAGDIYDIGMKFAKEKIADLYEKKK